MAEIKSTLELIMEKTKDLRMSEEEREALKREEVIKKAKKQRLRLHEMMT